MKIIFGYLVNKALNRRNFYARLLALPIVRKPAWKTDYYTLEHERKLERYSTNKASKQLNRGIFRWIITVLLGT